MVQTPEVAGKRKIEVNSNNNSKNEELAAHARRNKKTKQKRW